MPPEWTALLGDLRCLFAGQQLAPAPDALPVDRGRALDLWIFQSRLMWHIVESELYRLWRLDELAALFEARGTGRGEITVVVQGATGAEARRSLGEGGVDAEIRAAIEEGLSKRSAAREIAARSGRPAREIYARMVELDPNSKL